MKNLLYIAILTTVVVISWVIFGIYNSSVTSKISPDTSIAITPIPKDFNQSTILSIKSKKIVPADLSQPRSDQQITASTSANITPTPETQNTSSISAQVNL